MKLTLTKEELKALRPCSDDFLNKWPDKKMLTARQAVKAGASFSDMVWVASKIAHKDKDVERRLRLWLADVAAHTLHIFEEQRPKDSRPREAITAARAYANGEINTAAIRAAIRAAEDAARAARDAGAAGAAWDAAWDAARAARAAAEDAAWDAARAARAAARAAEDAAWDAAWDAAGAAEDAARTAARTAAWDAGAAGAAEEKWQFKRLLVWLSRNEPEPVSLTYKENKND